MEWSSGAVVSAVLLLLGACGSGTEGAMNEISAERPAAAATPEPGATPAATPAATAAAPADCEPGAPQSPCPIVGRWRIVKVYDPALPDRTADEMRMAGATFTVTGNGDAPGAIRWDGPDTGQFDVRDVCTGPFLSAKAEPRPDPSRDTLAKALAAWKVGGADPKAARHLGCDQGSWATPSDASGEWFGLFLPMGGRLALEWYEDRFILAERIG